MSLAVQQAVDELKLAVFQPIECVRNRNAFVRGHDLRALGHAPVGIDRPECSFVGPRGFKREVQSDIWRSRHIEQPRRPSVMLYQTKPSRPGVEQRSHLLGVLTRYVAQFRAVLGEHENRVAVVRVIRLTLRPMIVDPWVLMPCVRSSPTSARVSAPSSFR
jgi:hypothetical protein